MFKEKSAEELAQLNAQDLAKYLQEKAAHDREQLNKLIESKATPEQVEEVRKALDATMAEKFDAVQAILTEQGNYLNRMAQQQGKQAQQPKTLRSLLEENLEGLKAIAAGDASRKVKLDLSGLKAAGTMTNAASITGEIPQALRLPGFNELPLRPQSFLSFLSQAQTSRPVISWVYRSLRDGAPAATAENATKPLVDSDFAVGSETVAKITDRTVVTMEMLDDIDFMENAIRTDLLSRLLLIVEDGAYSGAGTAGPPQLLRGVRTVAQAFAAPTALAAAVDSADTVDVLNAAVTQIIEDFQPMPTHIFMNPGDVALMRSYKVTASDRRRVESVFTVGETLTYMGIPIIPTTLVAADDFLIGHMPFATLYNRMAPQVVMGLGTGDFENNRVTLLGEWRGAVVVQNNHRPAFVAGDFTTAKAALETV